MTRFCSNRFKFDVENYRESHPGKFPMKHIKIYDEGAMQVDLWLDSDDVEALRKAMRYSEMKEEI